MSNFIKYETPLASGKRISYPYEVAKNPNITPDATQLIICFWYCNSNWIIHQTYYKKEFNWSNDRMNNAIKNLEATNYLRLDKKSKGKGKGIETFYHISFSGNIEKEMENGWYHRSSAKQEKPMVEMQETKQEPQPEPVVVVQSKPTMLSIFEMHDRFNELIATINTEGCEKAQNRIKWGVHDKVIQQRNPMSEQDFDSFVMKTYKKVKKDILQSEATIQQPVKMF